MHIYFVVEFLDVTLFDIVVKLNDEKIYSYIIFSAVC